MPAKHGLFITFEGGEGCGKSSQSRLLADRLTTEGYEVVLTREPGGTMGAEHIRSLLLTGATDKWDPVTESLLYLAARADHWYKVIKPALELGKIVICDRFHDSSVVYQGYGKGVSTDFLNTIYHNITNGTYPDRTYLIIIDPIVGLKRSFAREQNNETRFENMDLEFHEAVLSSFKKLAENNNRFVVLDGNQTKKSLHESIFQDICYFLK